MGEGEVRQRKKKSGQSPTKPNQKGDGRGKKAPKEVSGTETSKDNQALWTFLGAVNFLIGVTVMFLLGYAHANFMATIHENDMWFSNIKEVEREISFRTESGLYYSYYKQLINTPNLKQGVLDLMRDNITEHPSTINVLERMNIYQEVVLAAIYKSSLYIQDRMLPIIFYVNAVFGLHGMLICALYSMTWLLTGGWIGGALAVLFYIFNRLDTTRVEYVIPLRESFALPFLWLQLLGVTLYFKPGLSCLRKFLSIVVMLVGTLCFALTWQFNQFVLLLQAMALFGTQVLGFVPTYKVRLVYYIQLFSMLTVAILQFNNPMIYGGLFFSFSLAAVIVSYVQELHSGPGVCKSLFLVVFYVTVVFLLTFFINTAIKSGIQVDSDEHIYKFILSKFGFAQYKDFDVKLYVCNEAFGFLDYSVVSRMTSHLTFPAYVMTHTIGLVALLVAFFQIAGRGTKERKAHHLFTSRPDLAYHLIQAVFYGALSVIALRMKYLWTPYVCVFASFVVSDRHVYSWFFHKINVHSKILMEGLRHCLTGAFICAVLYNSLPNELKNLENLREFWDPDTVQLMDWINTSTPKTASFSGSMQLLAGVKLCTGRPVTNHPHYEDKNLRKKTKELYSYYARVKPSEVRQILKKYKTNYIILEDSICMIGGKNGCSLKEILDVDRGEIPEDGAPQPGLVPSSVPRFCLEVRRAQGEYGKFFNKVFENKTFRIYKVL